MKQEKIRIGTRDSQLALWQARNVQDGLTEKGFDSELVLIKSDGDLDLITPLYEMGVQGVFTKTLDAALLSNRIDLAVHSMKDVPTQLAKGIKQAAVLPRGNQLDLLVPKKDTDFLQQDHPATIATSSIRRKAQWLHRYPYHVISNLRGNVNTRLRKLAEEPWDAAIFAAAGLERIGLRPENAIELNWMLPAPAQGAIMIVCRDENSAAFEAASLLNHNETALCTQIEKDFLRGLMGGCSTPISAYCYAENNNYYFQGNVFSADGKQTVAVDAVATTGEMAIGLGIRAAEQILEKGAGQILAKFKTDG